MKSMRDKPAVRFRARRYSFAEWPGSGMLVDTLGLGVLMLRTMMVLSALLSSTVAMAQTPDGETPADEVVCDGYIGAAYGLCVAYCEAMDCDGDANADDSACERVLSRFRAKSGDTEAPSCSTEPEECPAEDKPFDYCIAEFTDPCTLALEYTDSCQCADAGFTWGQCTSE